MTTIRIVLTGLLLTTVACNDANDVGGARSGLSAGATVAGFEQIGVPGPVTTADRFSGLPSRVPDRSCDRRDDGLRVGLDEGDTYILRGAPPDSGRVAAILADDTSQATTITSLQSATTVNETAISTLQATATDLDGRLTALESGPLRPCPSGMVAAGSFCIDRYEATVYASSDCSGTRYGASSDDYPGTFPDNGSATTTLSACSIEGVLPSRYVTWFQAAQACVGAGKRLCTNDEWQAAVAGTPSDGTTCNGSGTLGNTGARAGCVSNHGANDMVGNLREWVATWVTEPGWNGAPSAWPATDYGSDGYWHGGSVSSPAWNSNGSYEVDFGSGIHARLPGAVERGGAYNDAESLTGPFYVDVNMGPGFSGPTVGFRCCRSR